MTNNPAAKEPKKKSAIPKIRTYDYATTRFLFEVSTVGFTKKAFIVEFNSYVGSMRSDVTTFRSAALSTATHHGDQWTLLADVPTGSFLEASWT